MDIGDVLNKLIPADDLHWVDGEGFRMMSEDEVLYIIDVCKEQNMEDDDIFKTVRWCESVRAGQLLVKNVMAGGIRIHHFDENNQPTFVKNEN